MTNIQFRSRKPTRVESEVPVKVDAWTSRLLPWVIGVAAFLVYVRTVTPGMQMGDGTEFATMAHVLGVPHPTGYPLYMLLLKAWLVVTMGGEVILRTTLFNSVCMAAAVGLLTQLLLSVLTAAWPQLPGKLRVLAAAAGALSTGLLRHHWNSAVVTEVYALEFLLMVGFLRAAQCWSSTKSDRAILAMALLLGLGLAHHRISVFLILPFAWILWRHHKTTIRSQKPGTSSRRAPLLASGIILSALALYVYLPLRANAALAWGNTNTWSGFWDHVRGTEYFFRSMLRAAPDRAFTPATWLVFVGHQAQQFLMDAVTQFAPMRERVIANAVVGRYFSGVTLAGAVGIFVLLGLGVVGFVRWFRAQPVAAACVALVAAQNFAFLFIYNIPDIRDYTLLPLGFLWWCAYLGVLAGVARLVQQDEGGSKAQVIGYALLLLPLTTALANWRFCDHSNDTLAEDISALALPNSKELLPEGAILLTAGDTDTFTSWYRQHVRGERRDVLVYASNFIHMPWYPKFFSPEQIAKYGLSFASRVAYNPAGFVEQLEKGVITPNIGKHPIFTSSQDRHVLDVLASRYHLQSVQQLHIADGGSTLSLYRITPKL